MPRIHLFGASGSGTTTLGRAVAQALRIPFFDTDDYFWEWEGAAAPFTVKRPLERRLALLSADMQADSWVNSGSLCGWGDPLVPRFTLAAFMYVPKEARLARLHEREYARFGERIQPGGDMREQHLAFLDWASRYDTGGEDMRSLAEHAKWIQTLPCPCLRLDGEKPLRELADEVIRASGEERSFGE